MLDVSEARHERQEAGCGQSPLCFDMRVTAVCFNDVLQASATEYVFFSYFRNAMVYAVSADIELVRTHSHETAMVSRMFREGLFRSRGHVGRER